MPSPPHTFARVEVEMHHVKGSDIVILCRSLASENPTALAAIKAKLEPATRTVLEGLLVSTWVPIEHATSIYAAAGEALFPGQPAACVRLGALMARRSYSGIYRVFLAIPSLSFVLSASAKMWSSYHDTGSAKVELDGKRGAFVVRDAPELTPPILDAICGHLITVLELTGNKNVRCVLDLGEPGVWRWRASWE